MNNSEIYEGFMRGNGMFVNDIDELVNALHLIATNPQIYYTTSRYN